MKPGVIAGACAIVLLPLGIWSCVKLRGPREQHEAIAEVTDPGNLNPKGFKVVDFYPASNGVQKVKTMITGTEAQPLSNDFIYLTLPRITSYREDGKLQWIATSLDALVNLKTHSAEGTNISSFRTADTNMFGSAVGFLWQQADGVLILSNNTYTWVNRTAFHNSRTNK